MVENEADFSVADSDGDVIFFVPNRIGRHEALRQGAPE